MFINDQDSHNSNYLYMCIYIYIYIYIYICMYVIYSLFLDRTSNLRNWFHEIKKQNIKNGLEAVHIQLR